MQTLLWLTLGVLLGLLAWLLPAFWIWLAVAAGLALIAAWLPTDGTAVLAKVAIGTGGLYLAFFLPVLARDPLAASGATYLVVGVGLAITVLGVAAVIRGRRRRLRRQAAAAAPT